MTETSDQSLGTAAEESGTQGAENSSSRNVTRKEADALLEAVDRLIGDARRTVESGPSLRPAEPTPGEKEDEDAIEQYMARLMERVGGRAGSGRRAVQAAQPVSPPAEKAPAVKSSAQREQTAPERPAAARRVAAPENSGDLSRLREVANQSASTAVHTHYRKSMRQAIGLLGMTCGCLFTAYGILAWPIVAQPWSGAAAVLVLGAAATALWRYHKTIRGLAAVSPHASNPASPEDGVMAAPRSPSADTPTTESTAKSK